MRDKVLIYSDCFTYSGSENVIENIMCSKLIDKTFEVKFCYASSRDYTRMFWQRMHSQVSTHDVYPLSILSKGHLVNAFRKKSNSPAKRYFSVAIALVIAFLEKIFLAHIYNTLLLYSTFKKSKPQILYINNGGYPGAISCRLAVIAGRLAGIEKIIFNVNNMAYPQKGFFDKKLDDYIKKYVSLFITASFAAQKRLIDIRSFPKSKFVRIPNTLLEENLQVEENFHFDINEKRIKFGSIGLLTHRKGFHVLIKAAKLLIDLGNKNFVIYILGDGEEKENLENQILSSNLENHIFLLGYQRKPQNFLKDFDVFVLPSVSNEDFPYVVLEGMYLSKPIIGTHVAGIPEQVIDNVNGYVVEPNDPIELAESLSKFLNQPSLMKKMGEISRQNYSTYFSYNIVENSYYQLFCSLLNKKQLCL